MERTRENGNKSREKEKKKSMRCKLCYIDYVMALPNTNALLLNSKKRMK